MTRARRAKLIVDNMPRVATIARQVARDFAPHLALEDFIQDGLLGLCEAAARCSDVRTFKQYAYFRVRGQMVDSHRRRAYREELMPSSEGLPLSEQTAGDVADFPEGDDNPARALEQAQAGIFRAVWDLPVRLQRIIVFRYVMDLSVEEIGHRLNVSNTQVRVLHGEALERLRPVAEAMR